MLDFCMTLIFFATGAILGSFGCCQVWRIRKGDKTKRSHCMNCDYQLKWYDNVPILSWLLLGGKCRKCRKKIGVTELMAELISGAVFALSYLLWPGGLDFASGVSPTVGLKFALFLMLLACFVILFIYDLKWKEMPTLVLWVATGIGVAFCAVNLLNEHFAGDGLDWGDWSNLIGAIGILPGFYFLMYVMSREKWVGGGDWILCLPLAMCLSNVWLAAFVLFGSNMIGVSVMLPMMARANKKKKQRQIPFGPFLITAFLIVFFCQNVLIEFVSF